MPNAPIPFEEHRLSAMNALREIVEEDANAAAIRVEAAKALLAETRPTYPRYGAGIMYQGVGS